METGAFFMQNLKPYYSTELYPSITELWSHIDAELNIMLDSATDLHTNFSSQFMPYSIF